MAEVKSPLLDKNDRDFWFDNIKAFLILSVVIGHFANGGSGAGFGIGRDWMLLMKKFIYAYHMPVFMMVTGRFSKGRIDRDEWAKTFSRTIVPYLMAQIIMTLICCFFDDPYGDKNFTFLNPSYGLWYLVNTGVYTIFTAKAKKFKYLFHVSLVAALLVGFGFSILYGGFHRIVGYYPFFLFGYYTANIKFDFCKKPWFRMISLAAFIGFAVYVWFRGDTIHYNVLSLNMSYWDMAEDQGIGVMEMFLNAIVRYIIAFAFFFIILGISPTKKNFCTHLGTYSLYIYIIHVNIIVIIRALDSKYKFLSYLDEHWMVVAYLIATTLTSFIFASKPCRKLFRPILEPNFDLSRIMKQLAGTYEEKQA